MTYHRAQLSWVPLQPLIGHFVKSILLLPLFVQVLDLKPITVLYEHRTPLRKSSPQLSCLYLGPT